MGIYDRLGLNFDTKQFGQAQNLSAPAANTLSLVASTSGAIPSWQQKVLSTGTPNRTDYFQNPTAIHLSSILNAASSLATSANNLGDLTTAQNANNLIIEIQKFRSHTDNISGVVAVSDSQFPSFQSAQNIGQLNMMTLSKSDGVSNTAPILGSLTSLFIVDQLKSNNSQIVFFANEYANSISSNTTVDLDLNPVTVYSSNLPNTEIVRIQSYLSNTTSLMTNRRTGDWNFYRNSVQLAKDIGYMQQFSNMGGTATYIVKNLVGTQNLITNIATTSPTTPGGATGIVEQAETITAVASQAAITSLGVVTVGSWNANLIETSYGGTGLSSFNSGGAVYATSANTLTTGVLPIRAGGTGVTISTGSGAVVMNVSPILTSPNIVTPTLTGTIQNAAFVNIGAANIVSTVVAANTITVANVTFSNTTTGNIIPSVAATYNLGSANNRWANVYTSDLNLSNEAKGGNDIDGTTGNWTVQEGEHSLFIINNKTGKRYKFSLEEV